MLHCALMLHCWSKYKFIYHKVSKSVGLALFCNTCIARPYSFQSVSRIGTLPQCGKVAGGSIFDFAKEKEKVEKRRERATSKRAKITQRGTEAGPVVCMCTLSLSLLASLEPPPLL